MLRITSKDWVSKLKHCVQEGFPSSMPAARGRQTGQTCSNLSITSEPPEHMNATKFSDFTLRRHCWFVVQSLPPLNLRSTSGNCTCSYIHSVDSTQNLAAPLREIPDSTENKTQMLQGATPCLAFLTHSATE